MKQKPFDRVITLSLDPQIDLFLWTDRLVLGKDNWVTEEQYVASGRAVNLSKILKDYSVPPLCVTLAGRENRTRFEGGLREAGLDYRLVEVAGPTRETLSIREPSGVVTSLRRRGFSVPNESCEELRKILLEEVGKGTLVAISGKLPPGVIPAQLCKICAGIGERGGLVALDTPSISQEELLAIRPWLIKPDGEELSAYAGKELRTAAEMISYARFLNENGITHCLITLSREGLLYVGGGRVIRVDVPEVDVVSLWGVGESCLGGFILSMMQNLPIRECVCAAAAMGTAACLVEGAQPPKRLTTANILQRLHSKEIREKEEILATL